MANGIYYIYKITNTINGKIYIGFTSYTPEKRFKQHISSAKYKNKNHSGFHNAIIKYGIENFNIEILDTSTDRNYCLNVLEPKYIKEYDSTNRNIGYNISTGGNGSFTPNKFKGLTYDEIYGCEKSKSVRQKISDNHYDCNGKNNSFYGKHHTEATKEKIKLAAKSQINHTDKNFIIYDNNGNTVFSGKGIIKYTMDMGFKYTSALSRFATSGKIIKTRSKKFPYNGYYIKYVE